MVSLWSNLLRAGAENTALVIRVMEFGAVPPGVPMTEQNLNLREDRSCLMPHCLLGSRREGRRKEQFSSTYDVDVTSCGAFI